APDGIAERDGVVGDRAVGHIRRPTVDEDSTTAGGRSVVADRRLVAGDDVAVQNEGGDAFRVDPAPARVPGVAARDRETGDRYRRGSGRHDVDVEIRGAVDRCVGDREVAGAGT